MQTIESSLVQVLLIHQKQNQISLGIIVPVFYLLVIRQLELVQVMLVKILVVEVPLLVIIVVKVLVGIVVMQVVIMLVIVLVDIVLMQVVMQLVVVLDSIVLIQVVIISLNPDFIYQENIKMTKRLGDLQFSI